MIAQTIQLALAPVFVLVAIGNIMNILSTRLGRIVDRSRYLQNRHGETEEWNTTSWCARSRGRPAHRADRARDPAAGAERSHRRLVVALLFLEEILRMDLQLVAASAFLLAIALLMWALLLFLRETRAATAALRIPETYLELERRL